MAIPGSSRVADRSRECLVGLDARVGASRYLDQRIGAVRELGGVLVPTEGEGDPPYHCELLQLTPEAFDSILGPPMPNPVSPQHRWAPS